MRRQLRISLAALALCTACAPAEKPGAAATPDVTAPVSTPAAATTETRRTLPPLDRARGLDVSHHSGAVDWAAVAGAGFAFAYLKATEGIDAADPTFAEHWEALSEHGLHRGAYHFYVTEDDPEEQARFFLSRVVHLPGDLPPVVDIELIGHGTVGEVAPRLRTWLEIVEQEVGVTPIIYTSPNFWNAHLGDGFERYPLWIAEYEVDAPTLPASWSSWTLWQFDGDVDVPGVEKGADVSRVHPEADLGSLRVPAAGG